MELNEYEAKTAETAVYPEEFALEYVILGLVNEAGEVAGKYKKVLRDENGYMSSEKQAALIDELGDVLWYVARCAYELGTTLDQVAQLNLAKLASRKERGTLQGSGDKR